MLEELIFAGFGGQGVLAAGSILAHACLQDGNQVSWLPSYGPEQRGGTSNVSVVISDDVIGSPVVTKPTILVVFNEPSFEKFEPHVCSNGIMLVNSSLVNLTSSRDDIAIYNIDATKNAQKLGNIRVANIILLGALVKVSNIVSTTSIDDALENFFQKKPDLFKLNKKAFDIGVELGSMCMC